MTVTQPYVVVSGNIASGKSTLLPNLASEMQLPYAREEPGSNPWFGPHAWARDGNALALETYFILESAAHQDLLAAGGVHERFIREHLAVFVRARFEAGQIDERELELLTLLSDALAANRPEPDVIVWLVASPDELLRRVRARARRGEEHVEGTLLSDLDRLYRQFMGSWTQCPVFEVDTEANDPRSGVTATKVASEIRRKTSS